MVDLEDTSLSHLLLTLQQIRNITLSEADSMSTLSIRHVCTLEWRTTLNWRRTRTLSTRESSCPAIPNHQSTSSAKHIPRSQCFLVISSQSMELGGLGLTETDNLTPEQEAEIIFLVSAWLESLNSTDRAKTPPEPLAARPPGRRGMTLSEKIFALHDINRKGWVAPSEVIRVDVDWVIASEASWAVRISCNRRVLEYRN